VLKVGQNLPFDSKPAQHLISISTSFKDFDRDALLKMSIGALGKIYRSHATAPKFPDNCVGADSLTDSIAFVVPEAYRCELREFLEGLGIVGKELLSLTEERGVVSAQFSEHCGASFKGRLLQRFCKNVLEALPARWIRLNSRCG
jgi:hypothetical protein